jgi:hypothetical protein
MTKRAEITLITLLLVTFAVSFFTWPLFPVQRYPLFADSPTTYESYHAYIPQGPEIPLPEIELQNTYDGDPTFYVGRLPKTAYKWGQILSVEDLRNHFQNLAAATDKYPVFCLDRTVWGLRDDKIFGVIRFERFFWAHGHLEPDSVERDGKCERVNL